MNGTNLDPHRSFLLLNEISDENPLSQRELAGRLGIALGLVNSYLKNLVAKGYVRIKAFPRNRYAYLLTPQGLAEKSRLAYEHLSYFTSLYRVARDEHAALFARLAEAGVREVSFCGIDEVAEVAYLSLREAGMGLSAVVDPLQGGKRFFGKTTDVSAAEVPPGPVVITSWKRGEELRNWLVSAGRCEADIHYAGRSGAGKGAYTE
ncbi:MAG TPA: winged helix-turn-helix transcriptional regulator [Verrucomicrobiae bacterium]|nr:winged helix-turn-helix transcriptional regulator [Verrucomicrobiae bacterium]